MVVAAVLAGSASAAHEAGAANPLPSYSVDLSETTVSGLSSGAYMAGQFHVAFSSIVTGAGLVAGGPYGCAEGQLSIALNRCMGSSLGLPDAVRLHGIAERLAEEGKIDPLAGLADDRVYVFSGSRDETVTPPVTERAVAFYRRAGVPEASIRYVSDVAAGHGFITEASGVACGITESPFINDCDYDQAGDLLQHLYGGLNPPSDAPAGGLLAFDQGEFLSGPSVHGLGAVGFAYVPEACAAGETCRVHIAFHGCRQTTDLIGERFLREAGYNRWAESNRIIVLYPQAHETLANPRSCWDWWGYDDWSHATSLGRQTAAVRAMLGRLAGEPAEASSCAVHEGSNFGHWWSERARSCLFWYYCAAGSGDNLGFLFGRATVYEHPQGHFTAKPCAA